MHPKWWATATLRVPSRRFCSMILWAIQQERGPNSQHLPADEWPLQHAQRFTVAEGGRLRQRGAHREAGQVRKYEASQIRGVSLKYKRGLVCGLVRCARSHRCCRQIGSLAAQQLARHALNASTRSHMLPCKHCTVSGQSMELCICTTNSVLLSTC